MLGAIDLRICRHRRRGSDEFDRLEGASLFTIPDGAGTRTPLVLNFRDLDALPPVLDGERAALVFVKTEQGNLAKVLVSGAFKKLMPANQEAASVPVLILERFETIDALDRRSFKARGKGVILFEDFNLTWTADRSSPNGWAPTSCSLLRGLASPA